MTINKRLSDLRSEMSRHDIDIYVVPTCDFHGSEYIGDYFKTREFISGFTGSAGTVVVTLKEAALWTDGRYFLQAACPQSAPPSPCRPLFHKAQPQWISVYP